MAMQLTDALQQVDLEVGRAYRCRIGGLFVEVCVEARGFESLPAPLEPSERHARSLDRSAGARDAQFR